MFIEQWNSSEIVLRHVYASFLNYAPARSMFGSVEHPRSYLTVHQALSFSVSSSSSVGPTILSDQLNCRSQLEKPCYLSDLWLCYPWLVLMLPSLSGKGCDIVLVASLDDCIELAHVAESTALWIYFIHMLLCSKKQSMTVKFHFRPKHLSKNVLTSFNCHSAQRMQFLCLCLINNA